MKLGVSGVVINEYNDVLLIQRDDSRTWAVPGGGVEAGELPPEATAREVEEETGLKVMAVRLVNVQYRPEAPDGMLHFVFRCIMRGGTLAESTEAIKVGWYRSTPLPRPMINIHTHMLQRSLAHRGGPPDFDIVNLSPGVRLARALIYSYRNLRRRLAGVPPFVPPPSWKVGAFTVIRDEQGRVLWVRRTDKDLWNLPGGGQHGLEPPWETAVRETREETGLHVRLIDLSGVYMKQDSQELVFTFTAEATGGQLTLNPEAAEFAYFAPGEEPPNSLDKHLERAADAIAPRSSTLFKWQ